MQPAFAPAPQDPHAELVALARQLAPSEGLNETGLAGLHLIRANAPGDALPAMYEPGLAFVVQGRKRVVLGDETLVYDPLHYLLVRMTVLPRGQVIEASPERPYLCVRLRLDPHALGQLMLQAPAVPHGDAAPHALRVAAVSPPLAETMLRLLRLVRSPGDLQVLGPLAVREIHWRVLTGELGAALADLGMSGGRAQRVARAVQFIESNYAQAVRVEEVASAVHMSVSSLHHQFKAATSMSPVQYQKQLRLHHARTMMLTDGLDAASAAHRVGYESPSQFSRDYRRLFGAPPRAQIAELRQLLRRDGSPGRSQTGSTRVPVEG
jgi:AraC-like DNA-binding protein